MVFYGNELLAEPGTRHRIPRYMSSKIRNNEFQPTYCPYLMIQNRYWHLVPYTYMAIKVKILQKRNKNCAIRHVVVRTFVVHGKQSVPYLYAYGNSSFGA